MTIRKALTLTMSFAALFAAPMAVAQQPSPDPPPIVLRYGAAYSTMLSIYSLPIQAALREGFFAREGLDVQIVVPIPGGVRQDDRCAL